MKWIINLCWKISRSYWLLWSVGEGFYSRCSVSSLFGRALVWDHTMKWLKCQIKGSWYHSVNTRSVKDMFLASKSIMLGSTAHLQVLPWWLEQSSAQQDLWNEKQRSKWRFTSRSCRTSSISYRITRKECIFGFEKNKKYRIWPHLMSWRARTILSTSFYSFQCTSQSKKSSSRPKSYVRSFGPDHR